MMQGGRGKSSRKSNKIVTTPTQGLSAVVTPSTKMREREQANAKKIKQGKKKGLDDSPERVPQSLKFKLKFS
jgi:hypothetical protein